MVSKRFALAIALAGSVLAGISPAVSAPVLLGQAVYTGATGAQIDVNPSGQQVYISSGMGQTGLIRINAANPLAMSQTSIAGGWGSGVAVDPTTGRYATTNGYGNRYAIFNANDSLFAWGGLSGCGGDVVYGGGNFGISTQCSDHMAIISASTGAMLANFSTNGTGSTTTYNAATNTFFQNRTPNYSTWTLDTLAVNATTMTATARPIGLVYAANSATNRVYSYLGGNTNVWDGSTYALLGSVPYGGYIETNTLYDQFYVGSGSQIRIFDGAANALLDTINLPTGQSVNGMEMEEGSDRLYVLAGSGGQSSLLVYGMDNSRNVPEPAPLTLLVLGLFALAWTIRRPAR